GGVQGEIHHAPDRRDGDRKPERDARQRVCLRESGAAGRRDLSGARDAGGDRPERLPLSSTRAGHHGRTEPRDPELGPAAPQHQGQARQEPPVQREPAVGRDEDDADLHRDRRRGGSEDARLHIRRAVARGERVPMHWWLPPAASTFAGPIDGLFLAILIITGIALVIVEVGLLWFAVKYRGRAGRKAFYTHGSTRAEVIW